MRVLSAFSDGKPDETARYVGSPAKRLPREAKGLPETDTVERVAKKATQKPLRPRSPSPGGFANTKLVCWDFNGTLSGFGGLRAGLAQTASDLAALGAYNILTTTVDGGSAGRELENQGVAFDAYLGGDVVRSGGGNKRYGKALSAAGIPLGEASARLLVVGDSPTDAPGDLAAVFIRDDARTPAEAILFIAHTLDRLGRGDFAAGLAAMDVDAASRARIGPISFTVGEVRAGSDHTVPCITDIKVDSSPAAHIRALAAGEKNLVSEAKVRLAVNAFATVTAHTDRLAILHALADHSPSHAGPLAAAWIADCRAAEAAALKALEPLKDPESSPRKLRAALASLDSALALGTPRLLSEAQSAFARAAKTLDEAHDALMAKDAERFAHLPAKGRASLVEQASAALAHVEAVGANPFWPWQWMFAPEAEAPIARACARPEKLDLASWRALSATLQAICIEGKPDKRLAAKLTNLIELLTADVALQTQHEQDKAQLTELETLAKKTKPRDYMKELAAALPAGR